MYTKADLTPKCDCDCYEYLGDSWWGKRYRIPKGYYGNHYHESRYVQPIWYKAYCEECDNERVIFILHWWSSTPSRFPLIPAFHKEWHRQRYDEIKQIVLDMME